MEKIINLLIYVFYTVNGVAFWRLFLVKMGNKCGRGGSADPDSAWKQQNKEMEHNPVFKYVNFAGGGKLIDAYKKGGEAAVEEIAKTELQPFLFNNGNGSWIKKVDFIKWQQKCLAKITVSIDIVLWLCIFM